MYFIFKALAHSLILPPGAPLLLATLGAVLIRSRRRVGWTLLVLGLASEWLLCVPVVADELTGWVERYPALDLAQPTDAQAVVILGGGGERMDAPEYRGPVAESVLLERLTYGAYVARRTGLPILVSGAPQEAVAMRTTLARSLGIEPKWVDDQSRDTYENAHLSARISTLR